jgi:hypothetical protein
MCAWAPSAPSRADHRRRAPAACRPLPLFKDLPTMTKPMTPWYETPLWLRILSEDAKIYGDTDLASIVRLARQGCEVSLANARRVHERVMGRA